MSKAGVYARFNDDSKAPGYGRSMYGSVSLSLTSFYNLKKLGRSSSIVFPLCTWTHPQIPHVHIQDAAMDEVNDSLHAMLFALKVFRQKLSHRLISERKLLYMQIFRFNFSSSFDDTFNHSNPIQQIFQLFNHSRASAHESSTERSWSEISRLKSSHSCQQ